MAAYAGGGQPGGGGRGRGRGGGGGGERGGAGRGKRRGGGRGGVPGGAGGCMFPFNQLGGPGTRDPRGMSFGEPGMAQMMSGGLMPVMTEQGVQYMPYDAYEAQAAYFLAPYPGVGSEGGCGGPEYAGYPTASEYWGCGCGGMPGQRGPPGNFYDAGYMAQFGGYDMR